MSGQDNHPFQAFARQVGAAVVTFNSADDLEACLYSLGKAGVHHVAVIDNGSAQEHRTRTKAICSSFDFVSFEQMPTNGGFGAGANYGVDQLRNVLGPDGFVWIVNPDTVVHPDSIGGLVHAIEQTGLDIVSPRVTTTRSDGALVTWYAGGELDYRAIRSIHWELGDVSKSASPDRECNFITGAAMFMRMATWEVVGGFSTEFFLYWEDADLCTRASRLGLKLGLAGSSTVWHSVGGSGDRTGKSTTYFYYMQRNRVIFSKKSRAFRTLFTLPGLVESARLTVRPLKQSVNPVGKFISGLRGLAAGCLKRIGPSKGGIARVPINPAKPVFISWTKENGRSKDLADALGAQLLTIYPQGNLLLRYAKSSIQSYCVLRSLQAQTVAFLMLPPMPLALVAAVARRRNAANNIFDLHTGFFHDPKWRWLTKVTLRTMRGSIAIVTNENLAVICKEAGVKSVLLHDVLKRPGLKYPRRGSDIVCPVSYSNDEPIGAILDAAGALPHTQWVLTGRAPDAVVKNAPDNIKFTGFVSDEEYNRLIGEAGVVVALTNRKDTMQRAGYEAILHGVPVVTSDFDVLCNFFEEAALYVTVGESNLTEQVVAALEKGDVLVQQGKRVLERRFHEQRDALAKIQELVLN